MTDYGYIVVTVEDHRQVSDGGDGGSVRPTGIKKEVRIEDRAADDLDGTTVMSTAGFTREGYEAMLALKDAILEVRAHRRRDELQERWNAATRGMSPEKMEAALEVLEA